MSTNEIVPERVTATEVIGGVEHLVVLEQDGSGCYQEVSVRPVPKANPYHPDPSVFLG